MKKLFLLFLFFSVLFGIESKKIQFDGYISKVTFNNKYLIAGLESGDIVVKDFKSLKNIYNIKLPMIEDFMGDKIPMPIYSLDINKNKVLILAGSEESKRELFVFDINTKKLNHIFTSKDTFMKANFIGNKVFFGYLSDEVSLYDLNTNKFLYKIQAGNYVFSTFALNDKKTLAAIGDESGSITIVNTLKGKVVKVIKGFNKDQTLSLDFRKNFILNASSDKRVAIYNIDTESTVVELLAKFLPYGATLSVDTKKFAIQFDEKNDIAVYDVYKTKLFTLKGHSMALNGIKFIDNDTILSYSPAEIIIWRLK